MKSLVCTLLILMSWLLIAEWPVSAYAMATYDPSKCSTDPHGLFYFALGRRVFRQPMENVGGYIPMAEPQIQGPIPTPPNLNDEPGCPDHPLQPLSMPLRRLTAISGGAVDPNASIIADQVSVELINSTEIGTQDANADVYDKICREGNANADVAPGLNACWYKNAVDWEHRGRHGMFIQAKRDIYSAPHGGKYTLNCDVDWQNIRNDVYRCRVDYNIFQGLDDKFDKSYGVSIDYKFTTTNIAFDKVIEMDKELRRRVDAAQVKDFAWPEQNSNNGGQK